MARKSKPYEIGLHERLRNRSHAISYLNAAAEDSIEGFLLALRDVAEATKGMSKVAETADKNRENLYRMLSGDGNPRLSSLWAVLEAVGLRLSVEPAGQEESRDPIGWPQAAVPVLPTGPPVVLDRSAVEPSGFRVCLPWGASISKMPTLHSHATSPKCVLAKAADDLTFMFSQPALRIGEPASNETYQQITQ
jgi:probable addiction module antidote protein